MAGREYETRNYSFEEVNHSMAEQLALVGFVGINITIALAHCLLHS